MRLRDSASASRRPESSPAAFSARASASRASPSARWRVAPGLPRGSFAGDAFAHGASARGKGCLGGPHLLRRGRHFGVEFGKPVLLGKPLRGGRRRIGACGKSVPAPERALAADETLAGLEQALQPAAVGGVDDADLRQAARQLTRRHARRSRDCARLPAAPDPRRRRRCRPNAPARRGRAPRRDRRRARRQGRSHKPRSTVICSSTAGKRSPVAALRIFGKRARLGLDAGEFGARLLQGGRAALSRGARLDDRLFGGIRGGFGALPASPAPVRRAASSRPDRQARRCARRSRRSRGRQSRAAAQAARAARPFHASERSIWLRAAAASARSAVSFASAASLSASAADAASKAARVEVSRSSDEAFS